MNVRAQILAILLVLSSTALVPAMQGPPRGRAGQDAGPAWPELGRGMEKMHAGMRSIKPSGNSDIDFASLCCPIIRRQSTWRRPSWCTARTHKCAD